MRKRIPLLITGLLLQVLVFAQLTLKVTSLPQNTPSDADIYVAGTFTDWAPDNPDFILQKQEDGSRQITVNPAPGLLKFKFTRGAWTSVEGNAEGGFLPDRQLQYDGTEQTIELSILSWEGQSTGNSTAAGNVQIISNEFVIPQLDRTRRIWIYLPPDYESSGKSYPVLYMHDGQNLFDASTSFGQEWQVDESLNQLFEQGDQGVIVVGIDNGGGDRLNEYTPWSNPSYGGGEGEAYVNFLVETLKPYIDSNYRTRPEREYTGIMGSSLGGLISMYAVINRQDVYSKAGIFSPSFWFTEDIYRLVEELGKQDDLRIYMIGGVTESSSMVTDLNRMYNSLQGVGFQSEELQLLTHPDGQHSEWYWAREFPAAYEWLFANTLPTHTEEPKAYQIKLSPNPTDSMLRFHIPSALGEVHFELFDMKGQKVLDRQRLNGQPIYLRQLPTGTYLVKLYNQQQLLESQTLIIAR